MAFFKSFQQSLPSVNISSLLDTVSSRVDDLASAVSDATYTVSDQLTEQVSSITTIISKAQAEDEEDKDEAAAGQEGKSSAAQEGKANSSHGSKNNQSSNSNADGDSSQSQLEWEWRDGCWRVKKSEAEIEKEEKEKEERMKQKEQEEEERSQRRARRSKKRSQNGRKDAIDEEPAAEKSSSTPNGVGSNGVPQCDDDDHKEPPQSPHPQDDSRASKKKKKKGVAEEEEEVSPEKEQGGVDQSNNNEEPPQSPCPQEDTRASKKKKKKGKAEAEEEMSPEKEESPGGEEEQKKTEPPTSPTPDKKKKSDKKNGTKEDLKKSEQGTEKEKNKEKGKEKSKKKKKDKSCPERGSSDSEEDVPGGHSDPSAQEHGTSLWDNRHKHTTEHEGYSSETSTGHANSIQRIRRNSPLNELQPPPYQDEDMPVRVPRPRSGPGGRRESSVEGSEASEASADQDTESYLNKGYEEDVPSDSTAVLGPEDGSAPQLPMGYEPEPLAKYGTLDVAFEYDSGEQRLAVTVTAATDIPVPKQMGNISWQVHLVLLPTKKQRAKTGVQKGPCPVFTETFRFSRVEQDTLGDYAIRFRLYSVRRMKKEKVLGEKVFYLTKLNLKGKMALPVTLEPGSTLTGCGSMVSVSRSAGALSYRSTGDSSTPEILLGLIYNSTTGRLSAEVVQGSHFKNTASDKPPNTYVKLTMLDSKGKEMSKCKTSVCRGQPNPTYKETFVFQVALFQLSEVSLVVSVYSRRSSMKPRERLGWVSMGLNSTGEEQQTHWSQMKEAEGQQVSHWHTLMDT